MNQPPAWPSEHSGPRSDTRPKHPCIHVAVLRPGSEHRADLTPVEEAALADALQYREAVRTALTTGSSSFRQHGHLYVLTRIDPA